MEFLHMMFVCFFFSATILQYRQSKISKFTFLMNLTKNRITRSFIFLKKIILYLQSRFLLSRFYFMHFLQCVATPHFQNNKHIIISGSTRRVTDVSGICSFKKRSIKRLRKEIVCFTNFFDLSIYIGLVILN